MIMGDGHGYSVELFGSRLPASGVIGEMTLCGCKRYCEEGSDTRSPTTIDATSVEDVGKQLISSWERTDEIGTLM